VTIPTLADPTDLELRARLFASAREVGRMASECADQIEREQKLPPPLVDAMVDAGLFKMLAPRSLGGSEADPETFVRVIEEVSRWDASAGWCVFLPACCSIAAGSLSEEAAWEIFGRDQNANLAGSGVPSPNPNERPPDRATIVDGGYRVSDSWSFASGCMQATWLTGVNAVYDGDVPHLGPNGFPEKCWFIFPIDECQILDTWHVTGLRGTGSRDLAVSDVFVPRRRSFPYSNYEETRERSPSYVFGAIADRTDSSPSYNASPWRGLGSVGFSAVLLGNARGALNDFVDLAATKRRVGSKGLLRDDPLVQSQLGQAEATLRSARAFVYESVRESWQEVLDIGVASEISRVTERLAASHAAILASQVVDTVWHLAGTSGIREGNPLERCFRDVHVVRQNIAVSPANYGAAGQMFLKCETKATNY
jgi:indole-3-acetate monooxygenase